MDLPEAQDYGATNKKMIIVYYDFSPDSSHSLFMNPEYYKAASCEYAFLLQDLNDPSVRSRMKYYGNRVEAAYWITATGEYGERCFYHDDSSEKILQIIAMGIGP